MIWSMKGRGIETFDRKEEDNRYIVIFSEHSVEASTGSQLSPFSH